MRIAESPIFWMLGIILTGFVGWLFRNWEASKTLRLKDLRSKIDGICEEVNDIEDLAVGYFLKAGNDISVHPDGLKIKAKLRRVGTAVNGINREVKTDFAHKSFSLLSLLKNYRQSVTLDGFDAADRVALSAKDARFDRISHASNELKDALERIYESQK